MQQRKHRSNAERQKAYRNRKRNAKKPSVTPISARIIEIAPGIRVRDVTPVYFLWSDGAHLYATLLYPDQAEPGPTIQLC